MPLSLGVMSGIITGPYFKAFFQQPTRYEIGTMVAILEIGAFSSVPSCTLSGTLEPLLIQTWSLSNSRRAPVTSLLAGRTGDLFGRRKTLFIGAVVFTLGGIFQAFCTGFPMMVFGRIISGFGVGFLSWAMIGLLHPFLTKPWWHPLK